MRGVVKVDIITVDSDHLFLVIRQYEEKRARLIAITCNEDEPWFNLVFASDK